MATKYDSEGFVSTPLEGQGVRCKDSYFLASEADEAQFQAASTASTESSKQTLRELHTVDDSAVIQRANLQGALRQSAEKPYGDQLICQNLR